MSLRFAAARTGRDAVIARTLAPPPARPASNDNARPLGEVLQNERVLRAALLHFAKFGLGAAEAAREEADKARLAGDDTAFAHWLSVCRQLDRRMARGLEAAAGRR